MAAATGSLWLGKRSRGRTFGAASAGSSRSIRSSRTSRLLGRRCRTFAGRPMPPLPCRPLPFADSQFAARRCLSSWHWTRGRRTPLACSVLPPTAVSRARTHRQRSTCCRPSLSLCLSVLPIRSLSVCAAFCLCGSAWTEYARPPCAVSVALSLHLPSLVRTMPQHDTRPQRALP